MALRTTLLTVLLLVPAAARSQATEPAAGGQIQVVYTGRLMGYFRWPDIQTWESVNPANQCPSLRPLQSSSNVGMFLSELEKVRHRPDQTVLVGTGDNFGPELFATTMVQMNGTAPITRIPKDWVYWDHTVTPNQWVMRRNITQGLRTAISNGYGWVPTDNVACLLRAASYDAVVPGKYDFYLGPEHLRQLARLLATAGGNGYAPVQMLGANLVIATTDDDANPPVPEWLQSNSFEPIPSDLESDFANGGSVLPWARVIHMKAPLNSAKTPLGHTLSICAQAGATATQFRAALSKGAGSGNCVSLDQFVEPDGRNAYRMPASFVLAAGAEYVLNLDIPGAHPAQYVNYFNTYRPFFSHPNAIPVPGAGAPAVAPNSWEISPAPYVLKTNRTDAANEVAIFGVVNPSLKDFISELNYAWDNVTPAKRFRTQLQILDPVAALKQQLQYFDADYLARYQRPFGGRKVLLAQMPHHLAGELAAAFPGVFHLVVAAGEHEHASEGFESVLKITPTTPATGPVPTGATLTSAQRGSLSWTDPTVTVVPKPFYDESAADPAFKLQLQFQVIAVGKTSDCTGARAVESCTESWKFANDRIARPLSNPMDRVLDGTNVFSNALVAVAQALKILPPPAPSAVAAPPPAPMSAGDAMSLFRQVTLDILRQYPTKHELPLLPKAENVDVALLQMRDWFDAYVEGIPSGTPFTSTGQLTLQDAIDKLLWKGDFVKRVAVTGAELKGAMAQSDAFQASDQARLSLTHERGRNLIVLGIHQDSTSKEFFINAERVDDQKLYSVVSSDFVTLGDTGYPALKEKFWHAQAPRDFDRLFYISGLVCARFKLVAPYRNEKCRETPLGRDDYFEPTVSTPITVDNGLTVARTLWNWVFFKEPPDGLSQTSPLEKAVQLRPRWNTTVENLGGGYSIDRHNAGTEKNLADRLSGIQAPGLTDPKTTSWTTTFHAEMSRTFKRLQPFLREEIDYERKLTTLEDETFKPERPKNNRGTELGLRFPHLFGKTLGRLQPTVSVRHDTQVAKPYSFFALGKDDGGQDRGEILLRSSRRSGTIAGKVGMRAEGTGKMIEMGYQYGTVFAVPSEYVFHPSGDASVSCVVPTSRRIADGNGKSAEPLSVSACIAANIDAKRIVTTTPYSIVFNSKPVRGVFWKMQLAAPLARDKFVYTIANDGNLYFHTASDSTQNTSSKATDSSLETYYLTTISQSLKIPILAQLSLVPKVDLVFFQNKVERHSLSRLQSSLTLAYALDWRSGLPFKRAVSHMWKKK